jgi:hypothetical protein
MKRVAPFPPRKPQCGKIGKTKTLRMCIASLDRRPSSSANRRPTCGGQSIVTSFYEI